MTEIEFSEVINRLRAAYPRASMFNSKDEINLWYDMIGSATKEKALKAVNLYVTESERKMFAPSVGEIRELIKGLYEKERFFERQIESYFERAVSCYPNYVAEDPEECKRLFKSIVNTGKTNTERITKADRLYRLAYNTGINIDCGAKEFISFSDLMRGARNE